MDERAMQIRVGLVVLACLIIAVILVLIFSKEGPSLPWRKEKITFDIDFKDTEGVSVGTPVRKSGFLIGRVTNIELMDDDEEDAVRVTVTVEKGKVRKNEVCRITRSLIGDAVLHFVKSDEKDLPKTPVEQGVLLQGQSAMDPLKILEDIGRTIPGMARSVNDAGKAVEQLATRIDKMMSGEDNQFSRIMQKTEKALDSFNTTMASLDELIGDEELRGKMKESLAALPDVLKEARDTMASIQQTAQLANRNLLNIERFTKPLGEGGGKLVENLQGSVEQLNELMVNLNQFSKALNSRNGSLGQLVHNPELYQQLNAAVKNILLLTHEVKSIVRDARVLSDKLARNPELLGVSGALKPSPGTKPTSMNFPQRSPPRQYLPRRP